MNRTHHGPRVRHPADPLRHGLLLPDAQTFLEQPAARAELRKIAQASGCTPGQARSRMAALFGTPLRQKGGVS